MLSDREYICYWLLVLAGAVIFAIYKVVEWVVGSG